MPYLTNADLPSYVRKYSEKAQSQWRHVWMTVYESTHNEARAFRAANSVLKKRFRGKNRDKESHADIFNCMVDDFLGFLKG